MMLPARKTTTSDESKIPSLTSTSIVSSSLVPSTTVKTIDSPKPSTKPEQLYLSITAKQNKQSSNSNKNNINNNIANGSVQPMSSSNIIQIVPAVAASIGDAATNTNSKQMLPTLAILTTNGLLTPLPANVPSTAQVTAPQVLICTTSATTTQAGKTRVINTKQHNRSAPSLITTVSGNNRNANNMRGAIVSIGKSTNTTASAAAPLTTTTGLANGNTTTPCVASNIVLKKGAINQIKPHLSISNVLSKEELQQLIKLSQLQLDATTSTQTNKAGDSQKSQHLQQQLALNHVVNGKLISNNNNNKNNTVQQVSLMTLDCDQNMKRISISPETSLILNGPKKTKNTMPPHKVELTKAIKATAEKKQQLISENKQSTSAEIRSQRSKSVCNNALAVDITDSHHSVTITPKNTYVANVPNIIETITIIDDDDDDNEDNNKQDNKTKESSHINGDDSNFEFNYLNLIEKGVEKALRPSKIEKVEKRGTNCARMSNNVKTNNLKSAEMLANDLSIVRAESLNSNSSRLLPSLHCEQNLSMTEAAQNKSITPSSFASPSVINKSNITLAPFARIGHELTISKLVKKTSNTHTRSLLAPKILPNHATIESPVTETNTLAKVSRQDILDMITMYNMLHWHERLAELTDSKFFFELNEFNLLKLRERCEDRIGPANMFNRPLFDRQFRQTLEATDPLLYLCKRCNCHGPASEFLAPNFCSLTCLRKNSCKRKSSSFLKHSERKTRRLMECNPSESLIKKPFRWSEYLLDKLKACAAPIHLFLNPFPISPNCFERGMKLEAIDPENCSLFCVCTVVDVRGYRLKLNFDNYPSMYDFWVNADSLDIFPPGWCKRTKRILQPPKGYSSDTFDWESYLLKTKSCAAPTTLFTHLDSMTMPIINPFKIGMHLEAEDLNDTGKICVASIADILDERIRVHFDGWDDCYDFWAHISSPYIHPCGWHESRQQLIVPPDYNNTVFKWQNYIKDVGGIAADADFFAPREPMDFKAEMKLEVVDQRNSCLIRPATVVARKGYRIKLHLDCWPSEYFFWLEDDSPDLHPIGWCEATGHELEAPPGFLSRPAQMPCDVEGCRGYGNAKRFHLNVHALRDCCPYAQENWRSKIVKPTRLNSADIVRIDSKNSESDLKTEQTTEKLDEDAHLKNQQLQSQEIVLDIQDLVDVSVNKEIRQLVGEKPAMITDVQTMVYEQQEKKIQAIIDEPQENEVQAMIDEPQENEVQAVIDEPQVNEMETIIDKRQEGEIQDMVNKSLEMSTMVDEPHAQYNFNATKSLINDTYKSSSDDMDMDGGTDFSYMEPISHLSSPISDMEVAEQCLSLTKSFICDYGSRNAYNYNLWLQNSDSNLNNIETNPKYWNKREVYEFIREHINKETAQVLFDEEIDGGVLLMLNQNDMTEELKIKLGNAVKLYSLVMHLRIAVFCKFKSRRTGVKDIEGFIDFDNYSSDEFSCSEESDNDVNIIYNSDNNAQDNVEYISNDEDNVNNDEDYVSSYEDSEVNNDAINDMNDYNNGASDITDYNSNSNSP